MRSLILRWCVASMSLAMLAPIAGADAISSYTVTDLGHTSAAYPNPPDYTLSNTGGNGTLTTSVGTVYAFPRTDNLVANPQSILDKLPPLTNAPVNDPRTYGNPNYAYSYFETAGVFLNKEGVFAGTDILGVDGHASGSGSVVFTATRQADGTFGPLSPVWSTPNNYSSSGQIAYVADLNKAGQMLGVDGGNNVYFGSRDAFLYNLNTGVRTELASLLPTGWYWPIPLALDDQGRILVDAESSSPQSLNANELFLLTPAGLSSTPLPAPEPTTLATLALAGLGLAIRRRWKSRGPAAASR